MAAAASVTVRSCKFLDVFVKSFDMMVFRSFKGTFSRHGAAYRRALSCRSTRNAICFADLATLQKIRTHPKVRRVGSWLAEKGNTSRLRSFWFETGREVTLRHLAMSSWWQPATASITGTT